MIFPTSNKLKREMMQFITPEIACEDEHEDSQVANFYADQVVLILGSTGFIGKVLLEKLVRTCPKLRRVYLLIREKGGETIKERFDKLIDSKVFSRIHSMDPGRLQAKLYPIEGDITMKMLGVRASDLNLLMRDCTIVYNLAASIKFNEPMDAAVRNNITSVGNLIDFCDHLENLKALVHLSTAYSNCHLSGKIEEIVYEPPMKVEDIQLAMQLLDELNEVANKCSVNLSEDSSPADLQQFYEDDRVNHQLQSNEQANGRTVDNSVAHSIDRSTVSHGLLEEFKKVILSRSNRPNTYTLTKAIGEQYLVNKLADNPSRYINGKVSVAIVRPSIVGGCWREPLVGFIDSYNGATGPMLSLYSGALQAMPGRGHKVADMVPVDMVSNMLVCVGWFLASGEVKRANTCAFKRDQVNRSPDGVFIFNMTSGSRNPLRWNQVTEKIAELAYKYPSGKLARLPSSFFIEAGRKYEIYDMINQKFPALAIDFIIGKLFRQKLGNHNSCMAIYEKLKRVRLMLSPFTSNQWEFSDANTRALLCKYLNEPDKQLFSFDVEAIDWPKYICSYLIGSRIYTMNDHPDNLRGALIQLKLQLMNYITLAGLFIVFCYFIY